MPLSTPSLTADTWTRVILRIKGDSGISFNDDEGKGLSINLSPFTGTNYTSNSITNGEWIAWSSATRYRDCTSTWYTTNDATLEFTGIQLEVGSQATAFEHLSLGEEISLCQRYYQTGSGIGCGYGSANGYARGGYILPKHMRSAPTVGLTNTGSGSIIANAFTNTGGYVTYGSLGGSSAGIFTYTLDSEL